MTVMPTGKAVTWFPYSFGMHSSTMPFHQSSGDAASAPTLSPWPEVHTKFNSNVSIHRLSTSRFGKNPTNDAFYSEFNIPDHLIPLTKNAARAGRVEILT